MRSEAEIAIELQQLFARLEADDFENAEAKGEPGLIDTSNRITALEWVLNEGDTEKL
jgi:hypothetical protein